MQKQVKTRRKNAAFSLIELLVVVSIMMVLVALAVPSYLKAKSAANEVSVTGLFKSINTAEGLYANQYSMYTSTLPALGGTPGAAPTCAASQSMDNNTLSALAASGGVYKSFTYVFTPTGTAITGSGVCSGTNGNPGYVITAVPLTSASGSRSFCTDESGTIHYDPVLSAPLTEADCEKLPTL